MMGRGLRVQAGAGLRMNQSRAQLLTQGEDTRGSRASMLSLGQLTHRDLARPPWGSCMQLGLGGFCSCPQGTCPPGDLTTNISD